MKAHELRAGLIAELRRVIDAADAKGGATAEDKAAIEKIEADIDVQDVAIRAAEAVAKATTLDASDAADAKARRASGDDPDAEYRSAFLAYVKGEMGDAEKRALSVGTNSAGGYSVPRGFQAKIIESARFFGIIRGLSDGVTTSEGNTLDWPTLATHGANGWGTEAGAFTATDPTFGTTTLGAYKAWGLHLVSEELLQDNAVDVEALLARKMGENLSILENTAFVTGNGSGKPTGFAQSSGGAAIGYTAANATSQVTAILADSLFEVFHSLTPPYRNTATWVMNDASVKIIRKLKDSQGRYLLTDGGGLAGIGGDVLLGRPVVADPDMPVMAASARSIAFGDFKRGYIVRDAGQIAVQRLNELYAANGQVGFRVWRRLDGKVTDPLALVLFQNAAS